MSVSKVTVASTSETSRSRSAGVVKKGVTERSETPPVPIASLTPIEALTNG